MLARSIPEGAERQRFLDALPLAPPAPECSAPSGAAATTPAAAPERAGQFDATLLDAAQQRLAFYLGPIAGVLVARAARRSSSVAALYQALAAEIADEEDRRAFLSTTPAADG
jgi:serine/threonine-protein kinase